MYVFDIHRHHATMMIYTQFLSRNMQQTTSQKAPLARFPLGLLCDHSQKTKFQKVVKSGFKVTTFWRILNQYQTPHLLSPNTLNYVKESVINKVGCPVVSKARIGLFLWFFITQQISFFRSWCQGKDFFDIMTQKKYSFETRQKWPWSQNWTPKMTQMVPPG